MNNNGNHLILGTRKGLLVFERQDSGGWKRRSESHLGHPVPYGMLDSRHGDRGTLWASLDHGHWGSKLQRSRDLGESWEEIEPPKFGEGDVVRNPYPEGGDINEFDISKKPTKAASVVYMWMINTGGDDQPNRLYIGSEPGALFVSDDAGDTWSLNQGLWNHPSRLDKWMGGGRDHPAIHSVLVDPRDSNHVYVGISCAGTFETKDGGESWSPRNKGVRCDFLPPGETEVGHDPHIMAQCHQHPDVMWQQNHCGIFRTDNGCESWDDITDADGEANFGFAIACDADDPNVAWVVPAIADQCRVPINGALCVCRTTNGGKSWDTLRRGLPQENAYDVVFRHALDVHGDTVVFGTTTGNVYVSNDRGDSWDCLGSNFAPVYSVRFA